MQATLRGLGFRGTVGASAALSGASTARHFVAGANREHPVTATDPVAEAASGAPHTEIHEVESHDIDFEIVSESEIRDALGLRRDGTSNTSCVALERYSDSDTESTVSFGAEADAQLEIPIATAHGLLGRLIRNPAVQQAVMGVLREDPEFAQLTGAPGAHVMQQMGGGGWPLMLPAAADVVWTETEEAQRNPLQALVGHIGAGLQGLGKQLATAGIRLGHLLQSMGADLRRTMEPPSAEDGPVDGPAGGPHHQRALLSGVLLQAAVCALMLIVFRRAGVARFSTA